MSKLTALKRQIAALEAQAERIAKTEMASAIAKVKDIMSEFNLTIEHLTQTVTGKRAAKKTKAKVKTASAPKYADPKTGKTWTGFGRAPDWIAGAKNRDAFLVGRAPAATEPAATKSPAAKKSATKVSKASKPTKAAVKSAAKTSAPVAKKAAVVEAAPVTVKKKPAAKKAASAGKKAAAAAPAPAKKNPKAKKASAKRAAAKTGAPRPAASAPQDAAATPAA